MIWTTGRRSGTLGLGLLFGAGLGLAQPPAQEHVPGRLLAKPIDTVSDSTVNQVLAAVRSKTHHKVHGINALVLDVPNEALDAVSGVLSRTGLFTFVERDLVAHAAATPNDPDF